MRYEGLGGGMEMTRQYLENRGWRVDIAEWEASLDTLYLSSSKVLVEFIEYTYIRRNPGYFKTT